METGNNVTPLFDIDDIQDDGELLTYEQCAKKLQLTVSSLQHLVHRRRIPYCKVGRHTVRFIWKDVVETLKQGGSYGPED